MTGPAGKIDSREWLASREPAPPAEFAEKLAEIVGSKKCENHSELSAVLLASAENLVVLLGDGRESAADLLAADALITYALEAAADDCVSMDAITERAMNTIAALSGKGEPAG